MFKHTKKIKRLRRIRHFAIILCLLYFIIPYLYRGVIGLINQNKAFNPHPEKATKRIKNNKPISILMLGVDQGIEGRHDKGNSDTLILATINPKTKQATMLSIPRDTLCKIQSNKVNSQYKYFKINSAYEVGGNQCSQKTVSELLNVPIDYYAEVNMKSLKEIVNALGGVTVDVPFKFSYDWCDFHKGKQHLNGRHAISYARMRHDDPKGDYGRQMRQRQIIQAIIKKAAAKPSIAKYSKLIKIFTKYAKTNLSVSDLLYLASQYETCLNKINSQHLQGHDATINNSDMQVMSTKELQAKSNLLRKQLDLSSAKLNNAETQMNKQNPHLKWKDPAKFDNYKIK